jgi:hypothetical protein
MSTVLITPLRTVDILLGIDWFRQTNCWIHPLSKTLYFPSTIQCDTEEMDAVNSLFLAGSDNFKEAINEYEDIWPNQSQIEFDICENLIEKA